jgi:hypothetical protein
MNALFTRNFGVFRAFLFFPNCKTREFSDPTIIDHAVNPEEMKLIHSFYQQAASDQIPGYDRIMQNSFGSVYVRVGMRDALKKDCRCEFP